MNRIVPTLKNGNQDLVISETICIDPSLGLELSMPINSVKNLKIIFNFGSKENQDTKVQTFVEGDNLKIKFSNFLNTLGTSLIHPLQFSVGNSSFLIRMYGFSNNPNTLCLTISIYRDEGSNA